MLESENTSSESKDAYFSRISRFEPALMILGLKSM